jgi:outer membrane protein insertion porin family
VNLTEGEQFTIRDIDIVGELVVDKAELMALVPFREGEIFSRKKVTSVVGLISRRLGEEGYAFADVRPVPGINEEDNTISLKFLVNPGKQMMVRYITFVGNDRTQTEVLRREMRQFESEMYRASKVDRSRIRLQRLNYLGSVDIQTVRVEGTDDQVDLVVTVTERFSGNFTVGLGFSDLQGVILNLGVTHDNIFGTGKTVSFSFDNSASSERYGFRYLNPYYTADGVSRGFRFDFITSDTEAENISNYLIDRVSLSVDYGIPMSEFNTLLLDFGVVKNDVRVGLDSPDEIKQFIIDNCNECDTTGDNYTSLFSSIGFSVDTRNRRIFADSGAVNTTRLELFAGDLDFYKLRYTHKSAFPLHSLITYNFRSRLGYGDSYAETTDLPFFERFFAGGPRSVHGYERASLGPRDSNGDPSGGNLQVIFTSEFLIPLDSIASSETFRLAVYWDTGNVFASVDTFSVDELRASVGVAAKWFSVIGPLEFSYAVPVNDQPGDEIQNFQFALGAAF